MQLRLVSAIGLSVALAACSSGPVEKAATLTPIGGGSATTDGTQVTEKHSPLEDTTSSVVEKFDVTVGGTVTGLTGSLMLTLVAGASASEYTVTADGAFTFPSDAPLGADWEVTVRAQPTGQLCTVANAKGTIVDKVTNVAVTCKPAFAVGGRVLGSTGNVVLANNNGSPLGVTGNALFTFQELVTKGSAFAVTVVTPPAGQACAVTTHASGVVDATVSDVVVTCFAPYASCNALHVGVPAAPSGVYPITVSGNTFNAYCDMTHDGGGWTRAVVVRPDTSFQGDLTDALGDASFSNGPGKLDDATITSLSTVGYYRFDCGTLSAFVKTDSGAWTSARNNGLSWTLDPTRTGNFSCAATADDHVFTTATGATDACGAAGMAYVAADLSVEGAGCYAEGAGWYQAGAVWVK